MGGNGQGYTFGRNLRSDPRTNLQPQYINYSGSRTQAQKLYDPAYIPDDPEVFYDVGTGKNYSQPQTRRQSFQKHAKRTLLFVNLPEGTTHLEIVNVIKGGMLLDVYLRSQDRTASVSFLEELAAQEFFRHVKRHDLYIRGKRVRKAFPAQQIFLS